MGEIAVKESGCQFMIVRISYPFGNPNSEKDFANKTIKLIKSGYGLFTDQKFSPTYIPDLADAVSKIVQNNLTGVCHVVCSSVTTPHEFGQYLSDKLGLGEVKQSLLKEFMVGRTPKPLFGGLVASKELVDRNWKEAVDNFVSET
jgi:dTDP-4-dehydrorhamnose reductase